MRIIKKLFGRESESQCRARDGDVYYINNAEIKRREFLSKPRTMEEAAKFRNIQYRQVVAVLDLRTPLICALLDGQRFEASELPQSPHTDGCRCVEIPIFKLNEVLEGRRPENGDKRGTVSAVTTFVDWFEEQSNDFQLKYLGKLKYCIFKRGHPLSSFVDVSTMHTYTDEEITAKFIDNYDLGKLIK